MRTMVGFLLTCIALPTWCEDIHDVLERSQKVRLEALPLADAQGPRAHKVRETFERVLQASGLREQVEIRVIRGETVAETLHGHVVVANESLADLEEGERAFILAHELGHVAMAHWSQMGQLYKRFIPGEVTPANTDPVAGALGRDASRLSHKHEFDADAFSVHTLRAMGHSETDAYAAFKRMGLTRDTPTHPGTQKRMASLRELSNAPVSTAELVPSR